MKMRGWRRKVSLVLIWDSRWFWMSRIVTCCCSWCLLDEVQGIFYVTIRLCHFSCILIVLHFCFFSFILPSSLFFLSCSIFSSLFFISFHIIFILHFFFTFLFLVIFHLISSRQSVGYMCLCKCCKCNPFDRSVLRFDKIYLCWRSMVQPWRDLDYLILCEGCLFFSLFVLYSS